MAFYSLLTLLPNILYFIKLVTTIYISNNIFLISYASSNCSVNDQFLFDNLWYTSPLRKYTILENIYQINLTDLENNKINAVLSKFGINFINNQHRFVITHYKILQEEIYENLLLKASILASSFDEIQLALTGGADSRLAALILKNYDNVSCFCYGSNTSQDRLASHEIAKLLGIREAEKLLFMGQDLEYLPYLFKGLVDSSCYKLNLLNFYCNYDTILYPNKIWTGGCYGLRSRLHNLFNNVCRWAIFTKDSAEKVFIS